jgi:hypothetical protein
VELTDFIKQRLDEDEAVARAAAVKQGDPSWVRHGPIVLSDPRAFRIRSERDSRPIALVQDVSGDPGDPDYETAVLDGADAADHIARHDPARVLAEIEAKRRIVDLTEHGCGDDYQRVQRALALPYADHPDYDERWKL